MSACSEVEGPSATADEGPSATAADVKVEVHDQGEGGVHLRMGGEWVLAICPLELFPASFTYTEARMRGGGGCIFNVLCVPHDVLVQKTIKWLTTGNKSAPYQTWTGNEWCALEMGLLTEEIQL